MFDVANPEDGKEISAILEGSPFAGRISLIYARRPDAYVSFLKEGEETEVLICRDHKEGKVVGFGAYTIRELYVNGQAQRVGYIFGLRGNGSYLKAYPLLHKAYEYLYKRCRDRQIHFYITTILNDNFYARQLLEKKRKFMPAYEFYDNYEVFALKTPLKQSPSADLVFKKAGPDDVSGLGAFLNEEGRKYQFFPVIKKVDLFKETFTGLSLENFYLVTQRSGKILAVGAAWDQKRYKQYIVQGYSGLLKWIHRMISFCPFLKWPMLPPEGERLRFFTLSFWVVKDHDGRAFDCLLEGVSAAMSDYPFFLVGLCAQHPLKERLWRRSHLTYKSRLYVVDWEKVSHPLGPLNTHFIPYLECGTL